MLYPKADPKYIALAFVKVSVWNTELSETYMNTEQCRVSLITRRDRNSAAIQKGVLLR